MTWRALLEQLLSWGRPAQTREMDEALKQHYEDETLEHYRRTGGIAPPDAPHIPDNREL
jgi:hypothetical protein